MNERLAAIPNAMTAWGHFRRTDRVELPIDVRFALPAQPVDATQVLNLSAGVSNAKVFRGRSFS